MRPQLSTHLRMFPHPLVVQKVLHQRSIIHDVDILALQTLDLGEHAGEVERRRQRSHCDRSGHASSHRCEGTSQEIWRGS